jgi:virginiamycin A acetyltransferase
MIAGGITMRESMKVFIRVLAYLVVLPRIAAFTISKRLVGADRALEASTQSLARVPGLRGQYLRRAFLNSAISRCAPTAAICWGTVFSKAGAVIDENVYIGPGCHIGLAHLERDVLLAAGVHVPSGSQTHGTESIDVPIREQPGALKLVTIGRGSWIGSGAIVMANVGEDSVVAAGSVVTRPIPARAIAGGVPAKVIRERGADNGRQ